MSLVRCGGVVALGGDLPPFINAGSPSVSVIPELARITSLRSVIVPRL